MAAGPRSFYLFRVNWQPRLCLGLTLGILGCSGRAGPPVTELPDATQAPPATTLIRFPRGGGEARLYSPFSLETVDWRVPMGELPPLTQAVGADLDQRLAFALASDRSVVALDLTSGRVRSFLEGVDYAVVGPNGTLFTIDDSLRVSQLHRLTPVRFTSSLAVLPVAAYGTRTGRLLAMTDTAGGGGGGGGLTVLGSDQPAVTIPLPAGPSAASHWGDVVAVATDSGIAIHEVGSDSNVRILEVPGSPTGVAFSPSGHRLYAVGTTPQLTVIDRYREEILASVPLPGPAGTIRSDPYGGWLLLRPAQSDSVWVIDVGTSTLRGQVGTSWAKDFPTIIGTTLLVRQGRDIVALDMSSEVFQERGRIPNGGDDLYLTVPWTPRQDDRYADRLAPEAGDNEVPNGAVYLQISSSRNPKWAADLVHLMETAGLPASRLDPGEGEEAYRVVLGPYQTREEAEDVARTLGRPSFIYQPQRGPEP